MKNKKIIYFSLAVLLLALGTTALFLTRDNDEDPSLTRQEIAQRRQIVLDSLHHMHTIKKAMELYIKRRDRLPTTDILLEEIVKLADMDLSNGQWDDLGVYTTEYFIYVGGCYSTWCYAEANRKDNSYSLLIRHDGKKWITQACATQNSELGRTVCKRLQKEGWLYHDGEI